MTIKEMCKQAGVSYWGVIKKISRYGITTEEAISEIKNNYQHGSKTIEGLSLAMYAKKYNLNLKKVQRDWIAING